MATVSDAIAAKVTLNSDAAVRDLGTLSRRAKETDRAFGQAGKSTQAAGLKMADGARKAGSAATGAVGGFKSLQSSVSKTSSALGAFGVASGVVATASAGLLSAANAASRLNEQVAGSKTTFGEAAGFVRDFSKTTAQTLGISAAEALKASSAFGAFFKQAGFGQQQSAKFSTTLVQLAGDLASFKDIRVEDALGAISSGLAGESEPLRRVGVDLRAAKVDAEALALGFANTKSEITETDRVAARFTSLLHQTSDAQGDAARTANEYANTQRRFNASLEDFKASAGQSVLPVLTNLTQGVTNLLTSFKGTKAMDDAGVSIGDFGKAVAKGLGVGLLTAGVGATPAFLEELGKAGKDTGDKLQAASRIYNDAVGKFGDTSPEAKAKLAELTAEVDKAEQEAIRSGRAYESTAQSLARVGEAAAGALSSLRGFIDSQRAGDDATLRSADARSTLQDAERELSELRRKGKVDAEKVADAERGVQDASQATADARQNLRDAEKRLEELRSKGPVDAEKVADAERSVASATRSVRDARRQLIDAEKELAELRSPRTAEGSARDVTRAELDLEQARKQLEDSRRNVDKAKSPSERTDAALALREAELGLLDAEDRLRASREAQADLPARIADAEQAVADARTGVLDATNRQTEAERAAREARAGDPEFQQTIARLTRDVEGARRGVEDATRREDAAAKDLREARAGDPDFERNLAGAVRAHEAAVRGVQRADEDLPLAAEGARLAQEKFRAKLRETSDEADALRSKLGLLRGEYALLAGIAGTTGNITPPAGTPSRPVSSLPPGSAIPRFADGGLVKATPGGTLAILGEGGKDELITPVSRGFQPSSSGSTGRATTSLAINVAAPIDSNLAAQIEYGARLADWRINSSGRP